MKRYETFLNTGVNIVYSNKDKRKMRIAINDKEINQLVKNLSKYEIKYFSESKFTLEDYFLSYYKDKEVEQSL